MVMLPYDYKSFVEQMEQALAQGDIPMERLDDAVRRILRTKFSFGLFDQVPPDRSALDQLGTTEHRQVAREAVRKSLVLLKDTQDILPLQKDSPRIVVAGSAAHNLGRQSGGWTVEWQGIEGNGIPGVTILDAIKKTVSEGIVVEYNQTGEFAEGMEQADIGIVVVGEPPYAEGWGDNEHPALSSEDTEAIARVKAISKNVVVIVVSGRPLDMGSFLEGQEAIIAAWLPGSEGEGVTDVLFGDHPFTGISPVPWSL